MARILVFGGHGKIALLLAPLLTGRDDTVVSVIRNPAHSDEVAATGAEPVVADIESLDTAALAELIAGSDAIVWSAGAGGGDTARTYAVDRDAAIRSMDAAEAAGVHRYVMVSYFGASPDHGVREDDAFFSYAEAKGAADEHLRGTALEWTILGPSTLTLDPPAGRIALDGDGSRSVARADVAAVIAATLVDSSTVGRSIRFTAGDVPIDDALAS